MKKLRNIFESVIGDIVSTSKAQMLFDKLYELDIKNPDILELEDDWSGGVSDLGNKDSAYQIQQVDGYDQYIYEVRQVIKKVIGSDKFEAYRAITEEQFEDWQGGSDIGPIGVTFDIKLARKWGMLATNQGKTFKLIKIPCRAEFVIMRGKEEEHELVIDANMISFHEIEEI